MSVLNDIRDDDEIERVRYEGETFGVGRRLGRLGFDYDREEMERLMRYSSLGVYDEREP